MSNVAIFEFQFPKPILCPWDKIKFEGYIYYGTIQDNWIFNHKFSTSKQSTWQDQFQYTMPNK